MAAEMGKGAAFAFQSAEEIWNEIRQVSAPGAGMSYARLDEAGLQWPCPAEDHPGTPILRKDSFPLDKKTTLRQVGYHPTSEVCTEEFPFLLTTGRTLFQFNAGTMTARTDNLKLRPTDTLDINPQDAERLGLTEGQRVRLRSRYGEAELPIRLSDAIRPGELFCTFHMPEIFVNRATSSHRDRIVSTPEFKVTAVQLIP